MPTNSNNPKRSGAYVQDSAFDRLLGTPGKVKILDVFLGKHYDRLTAKDVAEYAGINRSTFDRNIRVFLDIGIIEKVGQSGNAQLYQINKTHQLSKDLGKVHKELLNYVENIHGDESHEQMPPTEVALDESTDDPYEFAQKFSEKVEMKP